MIEAIYAKKSVLNIGLDPQMKFMPPHLVQWAIGRWGKSFEAVGRLYARFNQEIIDATWPFATSVKPQAAFYEIYGHWGWWALEETIAYAKSKGLQVITDAKRGDGSDTAIAYADGHIGQVNLFGDMWPSPIRVDAVTIHAYIGTSCLKPFLEAVKKYGTGIFVVDKTSFKPNSEVEQIKAESGLPVWQELAKLVDNWGKGSEGGYGYRNVGVVMGATYPEDARIMRKLLPNSWLLVPGYGKQSEDMTPEEAADNAVVSFNDDGLGSSVNTSRSVLMAWQSEQFRCEPEQFATIGAAKAAEFSCSELNAALKRAGKGTAWLS